MKKRNLFVTLLLVMAMLLSACGSKAPAPTPDAPDSTGEPVYGGVLRVASYLSPSVLCLVTRPNVVQTRTFSISA